MVSEDVLRYFGSCQRKDGAAIRKQAIEDGMVPKLSQPWSLKSSSSSGFTDGIEEILANTQMDL